MSAFSYLTIARNATGQYKEKGSKFLAFAFPLSTEDEVKAQLAALRKSYFDASHHCFAWVLGAESQRFRAFDDGEPGHSAGSPILGQIRSRNLTDVLVVVVRYFGGTKLGVGGLASAYKRAAEVALNNARIMEVEITRTVKLNFPYQATPAVMQIVKELDVDIVEREFGEACCLTAAVKLKVWKKFEQRATLLKATGTRLDWQRDGSGV